jgi:hypothetical protein
MTEETATPAPAIDRGTRAALIFALLAERLSNYYEHRQWPTEAQGASLAADWLRRSKRALPPAERKRLSALSDHLARQIATALSREAGLYTVHEMMESLDPNYFSEIGGSLMVECERALDSELATLPARDAESALPPARSGIRKT